MKGHLFVGDKSLESSGGANMKLIFSNATPTEKNELSMFRVNTSSTSSDLRVLLGTESSNENRFIVGRYTGGPLFPSLVVTAAGRVGIGVNSPSNTLDVAGTIASQRISGSLNSSKSVRVETAFGYLDLGPQNASYCHFSTSAPLFYFNKPITVNGSIQAYGSSDLSLITGSSTPRMTILNANGNVGIGTTNPQNKLDVNGVIRAKEIKVETGWADFVFDNDYELPSLSEVKAHIEENKHLPGIPSEAEVKENGGVGLGEMQVKLLQKIEELTLYVIQLEEKITKLEK